VLDLSKTSSREVDEVHLVDGDDDVLDAEQRDDERVPRVCVHHAVAGVDQDDRQVAGARAGRHVARVLLVARAVGDDELALGRREVAVGDVDGDALLRSALRPSTSSDRSTRRRPSLLGAVARDGRQLVFVDHLRLVQQPADEGALAVVDAAAREQAQQLLALVLGEVGFDVAFD
jgi:hypothetical protein